jgi:hypothetical protein
VSDDQNFATVTWTAYDVQSLRPDWTTEKCEEFLEDNGHRIQDRLIELGWEVIETLLGEDADEEGDA